MAKTSEQKKAEALMDTWASSRLVVFAQASIIMVIGMAAFAGVGYAIDQWLGTFPAFFIGGLVIAFPATQFLIYKKIKSYALGRTDNL